MIKWALKRSKIFANIPDELIKKFIQVTQIRECNHDEIICKRGETLKCMFGALAGGVGDFGEGCLAN